jgi:predicted transcriptional regulator of viral defense system
MTPQLDAVKRAKRRKKRDVSRARPRPTIRQFLEGLRASGRYTFTRAEALSTLRLSAAALKNAAWRLSRVRRLVSPHRGFYVIVPPEYRAAGTVPPSWIIRDLMNALRQKYYVGLLSAAALHGAAHQAPHEFQVVTDKPTRSMVLGNARLFFVTKNSIARTHTMPMKTPTGEIRVSTPEATALDLVRYPQHAGSLSNVATVLAELADKLNPEALVQEAEREGEVAAAQRVGYLLESVGQATVVEPLAQWLDLKKPRVVPLRPDRPAGRRRRIRRWRVVVNARVEMDGAQA